MKKLSVILVLVGLLLFLSSCKDNPPIAPPVDNTPKKDTVTLSLIDITHRSVSVSVHSTANDTTKFVKLFRLHDQNSTLLTTYPITKTDTTIFDDNSGLGLNFNTSYKWYAVTVDSTGEIRDSSNIVETTTLDTTSHEYTWQEFTISGLESYYLENIWGIDENNVYAAGLVWLDNNYQGVIKWDGSSWSPFKLRGCSDIYGFSENDIWIVGGEIQHYNGILWEQKDFKIINESLVILDTVLFQNRPYSAVWGTSSSNMYFGSEHGALVHWDGTKGRVVANFGSMIFDIAGTAADNFWISSYDVLAKFNGIDFEIQSSPSPYIESIFITGNEIYLGGGDGVFRKKGDQWVKENVNKSMGVIFNVQGTNTNNIFAVGAYGVVHHFNGSTWYFYDNLWTPAGGVNYGVYVTENKVFIVGTGVGHSYAKMIIGTRK